MPYCFKPISLTKGKKYFGVVIIYYCLPIKVECYQCSTLVVIFLTSKYDLLSLHFVHWYHTGITGSPNE